jgi:uncharacterized protein YhfF
MAQRRGPEGCGAGCRTSAGKDGRRWSPRVGDCAIVADGAGTPICIIEVNEVAIKPFNAVDAQFAFDYGEYGRTLEQWRAASWEYFDEVCARIRREPSETMPMVCQRFRRIYP